jgi:hypothetical protein
VGAVGARLHRSLFVFAATMLLASRVLADDVAAGSPVEIHGFASQGFIKTTDNDYLAESERGSFEFNEVGLNFTKSIGDRLRVGAQLFTRDLGPIGTYRARFDWFYLDYSFFNWLGVRAGRTKLPFGLYNETSDIDAARVPVLLPQSVYPTESRDFLLAQTGLELYGYVPLGGLGAFDYRAYGGTLYLDTGDSRTDRSTELAVRYIVGGRAMWITPLTGLQVGASAQALKFYGDYTPTGPDDQTLPRLAAAGLIPEDYSGVVSFDLPIVLWLGSLEYALGDLTLASEYGRWSVETNATKPSRVEGPRSTSERFYVMGSYRVAPWLAPGLSYSALYPNVHQRNGRAAYQHDTAATLRFDLNDHWLVKAEGHYMLGTAALSASLNSAAPQTLTRQWGLLLLKTTAYF